MICLSRIARLAKQAPSRMLAFDGKKNNDYWDGGSLKIFRGTVTMTPDDKSKTVVKPMMAHFFYMDEKQPNKVRRWIGAVGPTQF